MKRREELMRAVRRYDFALYDLMLYLDTHPRCPEGRRLFAEYKAKRKAAVKAYVAEFGPINALQADTDTRWDWGCGPQPWEREAN